MRHPFSKLFTLLLCWQSLSVYAQIPSGYYDGATGKTGYDLKTELAAIIDDHSDQGYSALWNFYKIADERTDGFVWDIYSNCDLVFDTDQDRGSGGTTECDKYNREHTFPQSWFDKASIPRADAHMVLPTDKKINSERSNLPYGETNGGVISSNGARKGSNSLTGYSGVVFEPADEFKGDVARIYFYMATRYEADIDDWDDNSGEADIVLNGTEQQVYETWQLNMLIKWHLNDPVSQKEIDRNNEVFSYQGNRNPFVDQPDWVACIWQSNCTGQPEPALNISPQEVNFDPVTFGQQTKIDSLLVTGANLSQELMVVSDNEAFQISMSASTDFSQTLSIMPDAGEAINTYVYIKFEAVINADAVIATNINFSQAQVDDINIEVSGEVVAQKNPTLNIINELSEFEGNIFYNKLPAAQQIDIVGAAIPNELNITATNGFKTLVPEGEYQAAQTLMPDALGTITNQLTINFLPDNLLPGDFTGNLYFTIGSDTLNSLSLSATVLDQDTSIVISFLEDTISATIARANYEITLHTQRKLKATQEFELRLGNFTEIFFPAQFQTNPEASGTIIPIAIAGGDSIATLNVILDTAQLNTTVEKSFTVSLVPSAGYVLGSKRDLFFEIDASIAAVLYTQKEEDNHIRLRQNPVTDYLMMVNANNPGRYIIYDAKGKEIMKAMIETSQRSINVSHLVTGSYMLVCLNKNNKRLYLTKFIKR